MPANSLKRVSKPDRDDAGKLQKGTDSLRGLDENKSAVSVSTELGKTRFSGKCCGKRVFNHIQVI